MTRAEITTTPLLLQGRNRALVLQQLTVVNSLTLGSGKRFQAPLHRMRTGRVFTLLQNGMGERTLIVMMASSRVLQMLTGTSELLAIKEQPICIPRTGLITFI